MKYLLFALMFFPMVGFAAPLTTDQATSLIEVVQSSPKTPASAFTELITAFSNISDAQAQSLIVVVQEAPEAPSSAFIDLLLAFTIDPTPDPVDPTAEKLDKLEEKIDTVIETVTTPAVGGSTGNNGGGTIPPVTETPTPTEPEPIVYADPALIVKSNPLLETEPIIANNSGTNEWVIGAIEFTEGFAVVEQVWFETNAPIETVRLFHGPNEIGRASANATNKAVSLASWLRIDTTKDTLHEITIKIDTPTKTGTFALSIERVIAYNNDGVLVEFDNLPLSLDLNVQ